MPRIGGAGAAVSAAVRNKAASGGGVMKKSKSTISHASNVSSVTSEVSDFADGGGSPQNRARNSRTEQNRGRRNSLGSQEEDKGQTAEEAEAQWVQEEMGNDILTNIKTPEWIEIVLAVTRIDYLRWRIEEEREERSKEEYENPWEELHRIVTSMYFESLVAFLILGNCFMLGWQASVPVGSMAGFFSAVEHVFIGIFLGEWCVRMLVFGWAWVFELNNAWDTFLVFGTGVFPKWILSPMGVDVENLRVLTCMRALRLVRIVRAVRMLPVFRELWVLIQGLVQSLRPLLWTGVIAMMILYIFGVAATELIGRQSDFADDEVAQELFGDPLRSMFTMFQMMTMDSWAYDIARPMMKTHWHLCYFFVCFIMVAVFVFWNLITAVIVENAMNIADEDSSQKAKEVDEKKKTELKRLADLFLEMDTDGTGDLSHEEFTEGLKNPNAKRILDLLEVKVSEAQEVWAVLDDGDGLLTIKEFTNGLRRMKGDAKAKDVVDIVKRLRHTSQSHKMVEGQVKQLGVILGHLESDVERIQNDTGEMLGLFHEMYHRLEAHIKRTQEEELRLANAKRQRQQEEEDEEDELEQEIAALQVEDLT